MLMPFFPVAIKLIEASLSRSLTALKVAFVSPFSEVPDALILISSAFNVVFA